MSCIHVYIISISVVSITPVLCSCYHVCGIKDLYLYINLRFGQRDISNGRSNTFSDCQTIEEQLCFFPAKNAGITDLTSAKNYIEISWLHFVCI